MGHSLPPCASGGEFERIRAAFAEVDPDAGMTACGAFRLLEKDGDASGSAHRVPHTSVWRVSVSGPRAGRNVLRA